MSRNIIICLIRHGITRGNLEHRYVGRTDEPLLPQASENLLSLRRNLANFLPERDQPNSFQKNNKGNPPECLPLPDKIYTSPMLRCRQTAEILFSDMDYTVIPGFRECDFGEFEYMNYEQLNGNADYQRYIDSGGTCGFPGGETQAEFAERTCEAFLELPELRISGEKYQSYHRELNIAIVAHGGTIMAIMDRFSYPHRDYFEWQVKNGDALICAWNPRSRALQIIHQLRRTANDT